MEAKLKHLELIQAVISRMAQNSFLFKGWAITLAAGLSAFGATTDKVSLVVMAVVATLLFWGLDAYYLWLERCFIAKYEAVTALKEDAIDFDMKIDKRSALSRWFKTCWRPHLLFFYGAIIAVAVIGIFALDGASSEC